MACARFYPFAGGIETHVYEVARRLPQWGVNVEVLTTDPTGRLPRRETYDGISVLRVRAAPTERDWHLAPGLVRVIRAGRWDLLHCQGYQTFVAPVALGAAWRTGLPSILTFHSGGATSALRRRLRRLQLLILRPFAVHARALVAVSRFESRGLAHDLGLPLGRFLVVPNGSQLPQPRPARRQLPGPLIISIGRLVRYKGHHRVIEAMPNVLERHPRARLEIVGAGPEERSLRRMIEERGLAGHAQVRSIPGADRQSMADLLGEAALVVLLSEYESQGIAALEALNLGRTVLVADASALSELVRGGLARGVPVHASTAEVAGAMVEALDAPGGPAVAYREWTWDDCAARLASLYRAVATAA